MRWLWVLFAVCLLNVQALDVGEAKTSPRPYLPTITHSRVLGSVSFRLPVLLYHYVREIPDDDPLGASLSITPLNFRRQLNFLLENGYTPVSIKTLVRALDGSETLPPRPIILTFDDSTADFAQTVFPLLSAYGIPAVVFVVTGFVGTPNYLSWSEIRKISRSPLISIGSHGLNHVSFTQLPDPIADRQILLSRNILAATTNQPIDSLAYPNGAFNQRTTTSVNQAGYDVAFTARRGVVHASDRRFELPRIRPGGSVDSLDQALTPP